MDEQIPVLIVGGGPCRLAGIGDDGALLLRPDGVIAWRSRGVAPDAAAILFDAVRHIGGR